MSFSEWLGIEVGVSIECQSQRGGDGSLQITVHRWRDEVTAEKELLKEVRQGLHEDGVSIGGDIRDRRCNGGVWDWAICAAVAVNSPPL